MDWNRKLINFCIIDSINGNGLNVFLGTPKTTFREVFKKSMD